MPTLHCAIGEGFRAGDAIRVVLTARVDRELHLFIEAAWGQVLEGASRFYASAPSDFGWNAHVLAVCDGDSFQMGPVQVRIEDLQAGRGPVEGVVPVHALRDVRFHVQAPDALAVVHLPRVRPTRTQRRTG